MSGGLTVTIQAQNYFITDPRMFEYQKINGLILLDFLCLSDVLIL